MNRKTYSCVKYKRKPLKEMKRAPLEDQFSAPLDDVMFIGFSVAKEDAVFRIKYNEDLSTKLIEPSFVDKICF